MGISIGHSLNDVDVIETLVHKGRIARKGHVFFVAKIKSYKRVWSSVVELNRVGVSDDAINKLKEKFKVDFLKSVESKS